MRTPKNRWLRAFGSIFLFFALAAFAQAQVTITANTNWSAISTGGGPGGQPAATDAIVVKNSATLTVDVVDGQCASLQLGQDGVDAGSVALAAAANPLSIQNGTFKLSSNSTLAPFTSSVGATIPAPAIR